jgi:hypothetical protein
VWQHPPSLAGAISAMLLENIAPNNRMHETVARGVRW